jgi:hypothetical protein
MNDAAANGNDVTASAVYDAAAEAAMMPPLQRLMEQ